VARPVVSAAAEELYEALDSTFTEPDEGLDWPLLKFIDAITIGPLAQIHGFVTEDDGTPGWSIVLDPNNAPVDVLPWLAQFVGAVLRPDMTEEQRRAAIIDPEVFARGRPAAVAQVAGRRLTGSKTILFDERYTGSAWQMRIRTFLSETPDPALTEAEIRAEQKPIGIVLTYAAIEGQDWLDLRTDHATWTAVMADYASWHDARTDLP
jgi:hypothetical protein